MSQYTISQWILFFFWYCFLGWIWECCYVSVCNGVKTKKWRWVNRGFLNGPIIPIYGFASISILFATIPVRDNIPAIFLLGMLAATIMELVTGSVMERLFRVKYWDYSSWPLNYHGYICLFVSLFWGLLSVLLIKVLHIPVEGILLKFPRMLSEAAALIIVAVFMFDFSASLREALDMRDLLEKLTECKEFIQRMERRLDAAVTFSTAPNMEALRELTGNRKEQFISRLESHRQERIEKIQKFKEALHLDTLEDAVEKEKALAQLEQQLRGVFKRTDKQYLRTMKHLRRNPATISKKYAEALNELKELFEGKDK